MFGTDGLVNVVAGLGTSRDKQSYTTYGFVLSQNRIDLENMFRGSWLARRIVTTVADDMTREWVRLNWDDYDNDDDNSKAVRRAEAVFELRNKVNEAIRWARLYGGCSILIGLKGEDLSTPLDVEAVGKDSLQFLHVLDRWRLTAGGPIDTDPSTRNFGLPLFYTIADSMEGVPQVHWTRVVRFDGQQLPWFLWRANSMWHDSELQAPLASVKNYDTATAGAASMIWEANVDVIKMAGLADQLAMAGGDAQVTKRWLSAATMKSFNRILLLDKDTEDYAQKTTAFSGLNQVIQNFVIDLCGACDIPATRLFGQSPAGLTATGESDIRNYYDHVAARQETNLRPQLMRLYEVLVRSTLGDLPEDFEFDFEPLWQMSDVERAQVEKTRAETDHIYLTDGVLDEGAIARELQDRKTYRTMEDKDVKLAEELALQPDIIAPMPGQPGAQPNGKPIPGQQPAAAKPAA